MKKKTTYSIAGLIIIGLIAGFVFWLWAPYESTNDAYVEGNQILINALRDGFVSRIYSDDTFLVTKGQPLVALNQTDATIRLNQSQDKLAEAIRQICMQYHHLFSLQSQVRMKRAEKNKAWLNFKHRKDVVSARGVSLEDFQNAQDDYKAAKASLTLTRNQLAEVVAYLQGKSIYGHPLVAQTKQQLIDAWVQRYRSTIYAPVTGMVANRHIQVGMTVTRNQPLMSVVPLKQMWVNANFKETQLSNLRIGQKAMLYSDYYGRSVVYHGRVIGIGAAAGNVTSLLPPQNLSGNWIKIVQRLPVRIQLEAEALKKHPLRLGLSMHVKVHTSNQSGPIVPVSNQGAPHYQTNIFAQETSGVETLINRIMAENLDPDLKNYANQPLTFQTSQSAESPHHNIASTPPHPPFGNLLSLPGEKKT